MERLVQHHARGFASALLILIACSVLRLDADAAAAAKSFLKHR